MKALTSQGRPDCWGRGWGWDPEARRNRTASSSKGSEGRNGAVTLISDFEPPEL